MVKEIGRYRDGGSLLFEYKGEVYYLDWSIGSPTKGEIFKGRSEDGERVDGPLAQEIFNIIQSQYSSYRK